MKRPTVECENLKPKMFIRKTSRGYWYWEVRNVYWTRRGIRICRSGHLFESEIFASDDALRFARVAELLDMSGVTVFP